MSEEQVHLAVHNQVVKASSESVDVVIAQECGLMAQRLARRAVNLPPEDQIIVRRMASRMAALAEAAPARLRRRPDLKVVRLPAD